MSSKHHATDSAQLTTAEEDSEVKGDTFFLSGNERVTGILRSSHHVHLSVPLSSATRSSVLYTTVYRLPLPPALRHLRTSGMPSAGMHVPASASGHMQTKHTSARLSSCPTCRLLLNANLEAVQKTVWCDSRYLV